MRKFSVPNINTPEYWDRFYAGREIDMEHLLRQQAYMKHVDHRDVRIIELGCGMSAFPIIMAERGHEVFGLDYSHHAMAKMKQESKALVNWVVGDALHTPFRAGWFDVVLAGEIIEHFKSPKQLAHEIARLTKLGGKMIVSTPHLEFEDPEHLWEFSEADLRELFAPYALAEQIEVETLKSQMFPGREYLIMIAIRV